MRMHVPNNSFQFFWKYMWVKKCEEMREMYLKTENMCYQTVNDSSEKHLNNMTNPPRWQNIITN